MPPAVRPLAFEVASLRHLPVVDARDAPEPELCFRSRSLVHVDVVALAIAERAQALGLESTWAVVVRPPAEPGASTLAIAPVSAAPLPPDRLREEARALAVGFADTVRARARRALDDRSALVVDPGTNAALVGGPTEPRVPGLAELTRREREVLGHFLQGYALDTIACELGISAQTVRNHLKSVAAKLGARSQKELRELFAARVVLWRG